MMNTETIMNMFRMVCEAPSGSGFHIDHMPDFLYKGDIDDSVPHVHTFYEIIWFQEGTGIHTVDFQDYEIKPNSIFFLAPGQVHHFDGGTNYKGVAIKLCTDFMNKEDGKNDVFLKYGVFHTFDKPPYYVVDDVTAGKLAVLVSEMEAEEACYRDFGHVDVLSALLKVFLVNVHRHGVREDEIRIDALKASNRLFIMFRKELEKEFRNLHTVQEYADRLNVAVRTLNKSVNECSGKSPLSFINDRIILEAKRQVRYTDLMIKEVAYNLGYEDPSYFVKFFKRETGFLPSEFRDADCGC